MLLLWPVQTERWKKKWCICPTCLAWGSFAAPLPSVSRVISFPTLLSASWKCAGPKWTFPGRCFLPWTLNISRGKMYLVVCAIEICLHLGRGKSQRDRVLIISSLKSQQQRWVGLGKRMFLLPRVHVPAASYTDESGCLRTTESFPWWLGVTNNCSHVPTANLNL